MLRILAQYPPSKPPAPPPGPTHTPFLPMTGLDLSVGLVILAVLIGCGVIGLGVAWWMKQNLR